MSDKSGAIFSPCRTWRYVLWREWDPERAKVMFIGLNPSTADEVKNDPTVTRCINYAKAWGYGGIYMMNIFAFRATDPRDMKAAPDPVGPENNHFLWKTAAKAGLPLIAAWGTHGTFQNREHQVLELLKREFPIYCLGKTKDGHPKHPLYLKKDLNPIPLFDG